MRLPTTKYIFLLLLWSVLLGISVTFLKLNPSEENNLLNWFQKKRLEAQQDKGIKKLNMSLPLTSMYVELMQLNANGVGNEPSTGLIEYFEQVIQVMPQMPEAYSALGFCYYYSGSKDKAYELFQKSFLLDPKYFWTSYNLALMSIEDHQYDQAEKFLIVALQQDPKYSLQSLVSSKIYTDVLKANTSYNPSISLQENYLKVYKALYLLQNKIYFQTQELGLHVRIF